MKLNWIGFDMTTMIYLLKGRLTSPLLTTIEHQRIEAAKYLIFRRADINLVGEVYRADYGQTLSINYYLINYNYS